MSGHDVVLRDAHDDDIDAIWALNQSSLPAVNEATRAHLHWLVRNSLYCRVVTWGCEEGVCGFLIGLGPNLRGYGSINYKYFDQHYENHVYVDRVVLAASAQRQGLGTRLYHDVVRFGVARGASVLCAEVNVCPRNDASLAFHAKHGFQEVGQQDTEGGRKRVSLLTKRLVSLPPALGSTRGRETVQ